MYSSMWRGSGNGGGGSVDYSRVVEKIAVIPSVETATVGKVYMYIGESNATYTHGYIYECVATQTASDVAFSGSIITSWSVADFVAYLQEGGSAYNEVTHGTLTYDASGGLWDLVGYDANGIKVLSFHEYTEDLEDFGCVFASSTHQDGDNCTFTMTTEESGKKWKRLDVQPAGGSGDVASVNGKTGVVVLDATDVNALPDSTKYVASASWTIDSSTYVMTLQLKDQDGANIGTAQTIDLPLESVVVGGSYDSTNKKIVLTLNNGTTIDVPVADLVSGLQSEITAQNPLSADLVDDTNATHKFVSATEKTTWNGKQDAISDLATIRSGAAAGATAVQPSAIADMETQTHASATYATKAELADKQDIIQYSTMPTASASNVGYIVQFVGTTDSTYTNGYFYKCVSDGQDPAIYSWVRVDVQPLSGSFPSNVYDDLVLGASGSTYTAPADGWFYFNKVKGSGAFTAILLGENVDFNTTIRTEVKENNTNSQAELPCTFPVRKGDKVTVMYNATGVTRGFRFFYAESGSGGGAPTVPTLTSYIVSTAGNTLTIADTSSAQLVKIYKNGVLLQPTEDYTISGTTLTMVTALVVGDKITTEVF